MYRTGNNLRRIALKRAKRHGSSAKMYKRKGLRRRWLAHQLAGDKGYSNTDLK